MYEMFANAPAKASHVSWHHSSLPGHSSLCEDQAAFLKEKCLIAPKMIQAYSA